MSENKNMRELSLDEMDKVSGGTFTYDRDTGMCTINGGTPTTMAQFNDMVYILAMNGGTDLAVDWLYKNTGFTCSEMSRIGGDIYGQEAAEKMVPVMDHFWDVYCGKSHH